MHAYKIEYYTKYYAKRINFMLLCGIMLAIGLGIIFSLVGIAVGLAKGLISHNSNNAISLSDYIYASINECTFTAFIIGATIGFIAGTIIELREKVFFYSGFDHPS